MPGPIDWLVIAAGVAAILWVNWYFFLAERGAAPAVRDEDGARPAGGRAAGRRASVRP